MDQAHSPHYRGEKLQNDKHTPVVDSYSLCTAFLDRAVTFKKFLLRMISRFAKNFCCIKRSAWAEWLFFCFGEVVRKSALGLGNIIKFKEMLTSLGDFQSSDDIHP